MTGKQAWCVLIGFIIAVDLTALRSGRPTMSEALDDTRATHPAIKRRSPHHDRCHRRTPGTHHPTQPRPLPPRRTRTMIRSLTDWITDTITDITRPLAHAVAQDLASRMPIHVTIRFDDQP